MLPTDIGCCHITAGTALRNGRILQHRARGERIGRAHVTVLCGCDKWDVAARPQWLRRVAKASIAHDGRQRAATIADEGRQRAATIAHESRPCTATIADEGRQRAATIAYEGRQRTATIAYEGGQRR